MVDMFCECVQCEQIAWFLGSHEYRSLDEWMLDSDYRRDAAGDWVDGEGRVVDPLLQVWCAMEACGEV